MNNEEFIRRSRLNHGDKYDYSKVNYKGPFDKVTIICPEHGEFEQRSCNHIMRARKIGCPKCGEINRINLKVSNSKKYFIEKSRKIHGDKYDYSDFIYTHNKEKSIIKCPSHGKFLQNPHDHLSGAGCPKCAGNLLDKDYFIEKAMKKHGNKYDYSKIPQGRLSGSKKVIIICPEHGDFLQRPSSHLVYGCPKCAGNFMDKEYFIEKAMKKHGNKYDYSKVEYKNSKERVTIICPKHGEFEQIVNNHLSGNGCPVCKESRGEMLISLILKEYDVHYIRQKSFKDLRNQALLHYDFYVPSLHSCIEYDGRQHFFPIMHWGGDKSFEYIQHIDKLKEEYCIKNKIPFLRLTYLDDPKSVKIKLLDFLNINERMVLKFRNFI